MKSKHEMIEEGFVNELHELTEYRRDAIANYKGRVEDIKGVVDLFRVADDLTEIVIGSIKIEHALTTQVVGVLAAMIYGITRGDIEREIRDLLMMVLQTWVKTKQNTKTGGEE